MKVFLIVATLAFAAIACILEIPKMVKSKLYKEIAAFCIILCFGTILAVLMSFDIEISNPSDYIRVIFSPITKLMKNALE